MPHRTGADARPGASRVRRALLCAALLSLLLPTSARGDAAVRLLNAVTGDDDAALDVVRGGRTESTAFVGFGRLSRFTTVSSGRVRLVHRPLAGAAARAQTATLADGRRYTVVAVGDAGHARLRLSPERGGRGGRALVRVVHAAPELGSPDLQVDGRTVARGFPFLASTGYTALPPGRHRLSAMNPRSHSTVISAVVPLADGTASTAYVIGGGGRSVRAVVARDGRRAPAGRAAEQRQRRGVAVHVVRRGESLWSIARRWLGPDATDTDVFYEVRRLWSLNADRVASGDPDLILPGLRLRLR